MRNSLKSIVLAIAASAVLAPTLPAANDAEIEKVKYTSLTFDQRLETADPMIRFERQYLLHGALEAEDYVERRGKYYTVFWKAKDRAPGMVVRFEYLQAHTGNQVHVKEVIVDEIKRRNTTDFTVIGAEYDGNWTWPDGTVLSDGELRSYQRKVRLGEAVDRVPKVEGGGNVLAWKVSLVREGNVIHTVKSFLWE